MVGTKLETVADAEQRSDARQRFEDIIGAHGHKILPQDGKGFVIGGQGSKTAAPVTQIYNKAGLEEQRAWQKHLDRQQMPLARRGPSTDYPTSRSECAANTKGPEPLPQQSEKPETQKKIGEILYCHATRQTRTVGPGHWFFHTGQWVSCASAGRAKDGQWHFTIYNAPFGKKLPEDTVTFASIEEVQQFVSEYFEVPVVKVKASDFPDPKTL